MTEQGRATPVGAGITAWPPLLLPRAPDVSGPVRDGGAPPQEQHEQRQKVEARDTNQVAPADSEPFGDDDRSSRRANRLLRRRGRGGRDEASDREGDAPVNLPAPVDRSVAGPQQRGNRRWWTVISFVLFVAVPIAVSVIYYSFIAAKQYAVEVRFAVRSGAAKAPTPDAGSVLSSIAGVSTQSVTDSFIVLEFIKSRDLIDQARPFIDIREVYAHANADWVARLNPTVSIEDLVEYWRKRIDVGFDSISQIITVQVRAFTPEDAKRLAEVVVKLSENLINQISIRSLRDAVRYAEEEVNRTEERLKKMRAAVRLFREQRQEIDPMRAAQAQLAQIVQLEADISATRAQIDVLRKHMAENAPNVMFLRDKLGSLERRLAEERKRLGIGVDDQVAGKSPSLSGLVGDYEELVVEREFAEKSYVSALASLERARFDAILQHRYLTTFINPALPQYAQYPRRMMNSFLIAVAAFIIWSIGILIAYSIHDHSL